MPGFLAEKGALILRMGYHIIPIAPGGKFPLLPGWRQIEATAADILRWLRDGHKDDGIGIRTDHTPMVDLDIYDPIVAREMQDYIHFILDLSAPVRIGNAPKRGLLFRCDTPFRKISSKTYIDEQGRDTRVEILGLGQQFVAFAIHPDTGRPYMWAPSDGPEFVRPEDLPTLTPELAHAIVNHFEEIARAHGWALKASVAAQHRGVPAVLDDDDLGLSDEPLPDVSEERVAATIMAIPNDDRMADRGEWLKFGMGWWHQTRGAQKTQFDEWSNPNPRYNDLKWDSFNHGGRPGAPITFKHLIKLAKERGPAEFERLLKEQTTKEGIEWVCENIKLVELDETDEERLVKVVQTTYTNITGGKLLIKSARQLVKHRKETPTVDGFALTEDGVALAFASRHRNQLKFCQTTGQWYHWTGERWAIEKTRLAFDWARDVCRELRAESKSADVAALSKAGAAAAVETFARADRAFSVLVDVWDTDPWLLGTPTGTVDLHTGILRKARPEDYITKITSIGPAEAANCPTWMRFLDDVTNGGREYIRYLQQMAGYGLTGVTIEQMLLFIYGTGGNGKGVFLNLLKYIFHDYAKVTAAETFTTDAKGAFSRHPTELADLRGARLVAVSEVAEDRAWNTARVKSLTGAETISARFLYKDFFEFLPQFLLLIVGNHKPDLNNVDDAMRRRVKMAPFDFKPRVVDPHLEEKLRVEAPGILRWAIDGCLDWQKNGFIEPEIIRKTTAEYFADQDMFQQWLDRDCEKGDYFAENEALRGRWSVFAHERGIATGGMNRSFPDKLRSHGFMPFRTNNQRGFKGLRLREGGFDDL